MEGKLGGGAPRWRRDSDRRHRNKKKADPCGSALCVSIKLEEAFFDQH
jgi:hypothetical protein